MTLPKSLLAYEEIAADLNAMLPDGGRRVCNGPASAIHWRHRANKYRALLREQGGSTPYDHLTFRILQAEPNVVLVARSRIGGRIETLDGTLVDKPKEGPHDELLEQAKALAKDLNIIG